MLDSKSLYKSIVRDIFKNFKDLCQPKHTHNTLEDTKANIEVLRAIKKKDKLKIKF